MIFYNNLAWIVLAYLIGSINFSLIVTKFISNKRDIRKEGSGNAGATNVARVYGLKIGLIVFILDVSKSYWLGFILGLLQSKTEAFSNIIPQLALVFVIIGHIFPLYFGFKGGKGAATLLGMIASISIILAAIGAIIFFTIVYITKYVSVGSIVTPFILSILSLLVPFFNHWDTTITYPISFVTPLSLIVASIIVAASHWTNIKRLLNKNENKIDLISIKTKFKNSKKHHEEESLDLDYLESIEFDEVKKDLPTIENALSKDNYKNINKNHDDLKN